MMFIVFSIFILIALWASEADNKLSNEPRYFNSTQKNVAWLKAKGRCQKCGVKLVPFAGQANSFEADHIRPYARNGKTSLYNIQALCRTCNRKKKDK